MTITKPSMNKELRERILELIHLAVRTKHFTKNQKNIQFLADDLEALFDRYAEDRIKAVMPEKYVLPKIEGGKLDISYRNEWDNYYKYRGFNVAIDNIQANLKAGGEL